MKHRMLSRVLGLVTALTMLVSSTATTALAGGNEDGKYLSAYATWQAEQDAATLLNQQIGAESMALLKNRNNILPLNKNIKNVSLFGVNSVYVSYGAQGSGTNSHSANQTEVSIRDSLEAVGINVNDALYDFYKRWGEGHFKAESGYNKGAGARSSNTFNVPDIANNAELKTLESSYGLYGDAAIIVISREGAEGEESELPRHLYENSYTTPAAEEKAHGLMLNPEEREMIDYVTARFENVIVLVNTVNVMELGDLEDNDAIDAILWTGATGTTGMLALGKILTGELSPSGHLSAIYPADLTQDPTYVNYADQAGAIKTIYWSNPYDAETNPTGYKVALATPDEFMYEENAIKLYAYNETTGEHELIAVSGEASKAYDENGNKITWADSGEEQQTVTYNEGIYMGYRWYETQAELGNYFSTERMPNNDQAAYDVTDPYYSRVNGVVYPFGYGLSYTQFTWDVISDNSADAITAAGKVELQVKVTNVGDYAGQDVVQVYYKDPYTAFDAENGIEKASANLVDFAKTGTLQPGESEVLTISFDAKDMATFDEKVNGCYVLEAGEYEVALKKNSHETVTALTYNVAETIAYNQNGIDNDLNYNKGYGESTTVALFSADDESNKNDGNWLFNAHGEGQYISRADGVLEMPTPMVNVAYGADEQERLNAYAGYTAEKAAEMNEKYGTPLVAAVPESWTQAADGTMEKSEIQMSDMVGVDYTEPVINADGTVTYADDEGTAKWTAFMNQLTVAEMLQLTAGDNGSSSDIERIGKPETFANDGGSKLQKRAADKYTEPEVNGTWWCSTVNITATFNKELAYRQGLMVGNESQYIGTTGMWGMGLNTNRGAWGARAFEYYSEDAVLAGYIAAAVTKGQIDMGMIVYNKHFAMNEQDSYRNTADGTAVYTNEQALRMIYLKPYEMATKLGGDNGYMSSFMRLGAIACDFNYQLLTSVARHEWGFKGDVCTDAGGGAYGDACVLAGNDWPLMSYGDNGPKAAWDAENNMVTVGEGVASPTQWYAIRVSAMRILWNLANSNAMNNLLNFEAFCGGELPDANNGRSYNASAAVSLEMLNAYSAYYTLTGGELPVGITMSADGSLSGTPTVPGTYTFDVKATMDYSYIKTATYTLTVNKLFNISVESGKVGDEDFEAQLSTDALVMGANEGEFETITYSCDDLPAGLVMAGDGLIYGTPAEAGTYDIHVKILAKEADTLNSAGSMQTGATYTYNETFTLTFE